MVRGYGIGADFLLLLYTLGVYKLTSEELVKWQMGVPIEWVKTLED